ncbi:DUF6037 family protein [Lachnospiraceae bacterium YH-ros2226]
MSDSHKTLEHAEELVKSMIENDIDKVHYNFQQWNHRFDCIFSIAESGYELLVGVFDLNLGFVVPINGRFVATLHEQDYFALGNALNLHYDPVNHFSSSVILALLSRHMPTYCNGQRISYKEMRDYRICKDIDEADKRYFCGWNDHEKDKRQARNIEKTEFYLGHTVAKYCEENNISSMWSAYPRDEQAITMPWNRTK